MLTGRDSVEARLRVGPTWEETGRVFTKARGGYVEASSVTHRFQQQLRAAGLPHMAFYDLRHGAASLLLAGGASVRTVMKQFGHSQISLTMNTDAAVVPDLSRNAADRMDAMLGGR